MTEAELTYQGRPLPRPQDEVVDQGLAFDIGTLHSRRRALRPGETRPGAFSIHVSQCTLFGDYRPVP